MKLFSNVIGLSQLQMTLGADCFITGAVALLQIGAADWLSPWLGISSALLQYSGFGLLAFVGYLAYCLVQRKFSRGHLGIIVAINLLWAIGCLMFIYAERSRLTPFGTAFVLVQVVAVSFFAALEYSGSRILAQSTQGRFMSSTGE